MRAVILVVVASVSSCAAGDGLFGETADAGPEDAGPPPDPEGCRDECIVRAETESTCDPACSAREDCEGLVGLICDAYAVPCDGGFNACKNRLVEFFECSAATDVGPSLNDCQDDAARVTGCYDDLPAACFSVILVGERSTPASCDDRMEEVNCGASESPWCPSQIAMPECFCDDGFVRDGGENAPCVETCAHDLETSPADRCSGHYGANSVATCDGRAETESIACTCEDGFLWVGPEDAACVRERCFDLAPHWNCVTATGEPDDNCTCDCRNAEESTDRPDCFCDPGFSGDGTRCVAD
jgi:hypothetical protein